MLLTIFGQCSMSYRINYHVKCTFTHHNIFLKVKLETEILKWQHQVLFTNLFQRKVGKHPVICHNNLSSPVDNSFSHRRVALSQAGPRRRGVWWETRYQVSFSAASSQSDIVIPAQETLIFYLQNKTAVVIGVPERCDIRVVCRRRTFYVGGQYRKRTECVVLA